MPKITDVFGVRINLTGKEEALTAIDHATSTKPIRIATVNPEFIVEAKKNNTFKNALEDMDYCIVDGSGIKMALAFFRRIHTELYHGATLVHDLFTQYQQGEKRFYLLGDRPGVAVTARETLQQQFPNLLIVGAEDGGIIDANNVHLDPALAERITQARPDILLVGFGAPKQELWMTAAQSLKIPVMIGVGGTFGFYGTKKRAPQIWQTLYLEWLYRLFTEEGHVKRAYRAFVVFLAEAFWWRLTHLRATD